MVAGSGGVKKVDSAPPEADTAAQALVSKGAGIGRVAGLDLGRARVGVAIADELGLYAHPRPPLDARKEKALIASLVALARAEALERFVVGLPLEMTGERGPAAQRAIAFAGRLADATGLEVELVDERLTTVEASRQLRESGITARQGKGHIDGAAAAILLQAWLDARRAPNAPD